MSAIFKDSYQTLSLPDGSIICGAFPTLEWFAAMSSCIDWGGKTVIDLGCCSFGYGIEALKCGAESVVGIDQDPLRVREANWLIDQWGFGSKAVVSQSEIEYMGLPIHERYDVVVFSMIIHWLKDPEYQIRRFWNKTRDKLVLVYRLPQPETLGYRPTLKELSSLLGSEPLYSEKLMNSIDQQIQLVIYEKV